MNKRYKVLLIAISVFLILTITIGVSYSIYIEKKNDPRYAAMVETDEIISVNYLDGKSFDIKDFKSGDTYTKRISITNVSQNATYLTISLMDVIKHSDNLRLTLLDSNKNKVYEGNISNIDINMAKGVDLEPNKTLSYTIMIENKGEDTTNFYANILAYKEIIKQSSNTFKDVILANNSIVTDDNIGKDIANVNGLIKTADSDGEAYAFRGNVNNNNVKLGEDNYKILRINGNSSIRLIFDGVLENQIAYNDDVEYKDDYTEKLLFDNSKAKKFLDSYLTSFLQDYSKYIVDSSFCEDVNVYKDEDYVSYLNSYKRAFESNDVTLVCEGNVIKNKIGLITSDEVVFAGGYQNKSNTDYFLYNDSIKEAYWTMSGSKILIGYNAVGAISVNSDGSMSYDKKISTPLYIRPVISIDANATVSGNGTVADPYILK